MLCSFSYLYPHNVYKIIKIITKTLISLQTLLTMWEQTRSVKSMYWQQHDTKISLLSLLLNGGIIFSNLVSKQLLSLSLSSSEICYINLFLYIPTSSQDKNLSVFTQYHKLNIFLEKNIWIIENFKCMLGQATLILSFATQGV